MNRRPHRRGMQRSLSEGMRRFGRILFRCTIVVLILVAGTLAVYRWLAEQREIDIAQATAPAAGRYVRAGDTDIYLQELGPPSGRIVLLVHGTGAWSETWRTTMIALAEAGFHAVAIDLPPFGYSQRSDRLEYSKAAQAQRIVGVLDALQASSAVLIGHSFGAGPTVEAALLQPQRVAALIIVDGALAVRADDAAANVSGSGMIGALLKLRPLRDSLVATFLTNPGFTRRLIESFIANPASATDNAVRIYQQPLTIAGSTRAVGRWLPELLTPAAPAVSEDPSVYRKLRVPTVLLWGRADTITPLAQGERLASLLPASKLVTLAGVGHIPQLENASMFNRELLHALDSLPTVH